MQICYKEDRYLINLKLTKDANKLLYILPISKNFFEKDNNLKEEVIDCIDNELSIEEVKFDCKITKEQKQLSSFNKANLKVKLIF